MKLRWKIAGGCAFLGGIVLGLAAAALLWYFLAPGAGSKHADTPGAESAGSAAISESGLPSSGNRFQQTVFNDPELMAKLEKLADVPEIRALLEDEEMVAAIESRNAIKLMTSKKFRAAASHPAMRELTAAIMKKSVRGMFGGDDSAAEDNKSSAD